MESAKEWTTNRAEELAQEEFDRAFSDLSDDEQMRLWAKAEEDYNNWYASYADALYDVEWERRMGL